MAEYRAPVKDLNFILFSVFKLQEHWLSLDGVNDLDEATARAVLDEAAKMCEQEIAPLNQVGDEQGCRLQEDKVITPSGYKKAYDTYLEGGWGALGGNPEYGGMGMPKALVSAVEEMLQGACMSFGLAPMLTAGACLAIDQHGSEDLKQRYLEKMYSGQWSGSMDLTEPHCGTDLGMMRSKAKPCDDGSYLIQGNKIFITWGEHDMAENIIHLVLARVEGAPAGTKGISLFLVPKFIPNADGSLGARNTLQCGALESKMGIKGSATCVMNFDNARGWLVGEVNQGLACMFTMMNYERLVVGIQALGTAHWSYTNAVAYAQERMQGKGPFSRLDKGPDNLLAHPDVRRMLLTSKAYTEAGRAFYIYVAKWLDTAKFSNCETDIKAATSRIALLTPVAKAFLTDIAFDCAVGGQQVLGGHGYIKEWGQEQMVRDIRITQIYEGTNGVQAMDLMGRKVIASQGTLLWDFFAEIEAFLDSDQWPNSSQQFVVELRQYLNKFKQTTKTIIDRAAQDPAEAGAVAVEYLNYFGHICLGYMWLKMLLALEGQGDLEFAQSKTITCRFYFDHILPKVDGLASTIDRGAAGMGDMQASYW